MGNLDHQLKSALRDAAAAGKVAMSSGDVQDTRVHAMAPAAGDVTAPVPQLAKQDPLVNAGAHADSKANATALDKDGAAAAGDIAPKDPLSFTEEEVVLTEEDRASFLDAVLHGRRYEQRISLFGGMVTARLRARSTEESEAIACHLNNGVREGTYTTPLEYSVGVRNAMLAAQVAELNGTKYAELQAPLFRTKTGEDVVAPGWLTQASLWSTDPKVPEAVVSALYDALRLFERKYWTMVVHANDQNFWQTAGSTSK